jgi:nicotinamide-nucleotide amidase
LSSGQIAGRIAHLPGAEAVLRRGVVARRREDICAVVGLDPDVLKDGMSKEAADMVARAALAQTGATHALAVLVDVDNGADRIEFAGTICLAIATANDSVLRCSRIVGGRDWVRLGAVEMGLDCLRRYLQGLPVDERIDFEKVE